ncbi:MAG TPA: carboxypeptidase-like regulatory domain-containing protein [Candidatus Acidoferrum sp.]
MTKLRVILLALIIAAFAAIPSQLPACSWAGGYFYQVTVLKGTVVGSYFRLLYFSRWFRQQITRPNVKLTLYRYQGGRDYHLPPIKSVVSDQNGRFDFGSVPIGHYTLFLGDASQDYGDAFDVEVISSPQPQERLVIDISPVSPDCKGGREIVRRFE